MLFYPSVPCGQTMAVVPAAGPAVAKRWSKRSSEIEQIIIRWRPKQWSKSGQILVKGARLEPAGGESMALKSVKKLLKIGQNVVKARPKGLKTVACGWVANENIARAHARYFREAKRRDFREAKRHTLAHAAKRR